MFGKSDLKMNKARDGRHCDLCGCSFPAVRCDKCSSQIFCLSCDDMYHRHPKRRFHLRKAVDPTPTPQARPMLPMKVSTLTLAPGDPSKMPLPPPRKKKSGKSIFDSFRRGSPASDTSPSSPKKEYLWTGKLSNITKFMSNRPLPPVPDNTTDNDENDSGSTNVMQDHSLAFIHRKVDEKPPALPQRQPRSQPQFPMQENTENNNERNMPAMTNGNAHNFPNMMMGYGTDQNQNWPTSQQFAMQMNAQQFGTIRRQSQPQDSSPHSLKDKPGGMHLSSSASDLTSLTDAPTGPMMPPYPAYPYNPHVTPPYPYPMYPPQFPPYPQYFGNSWANLTSPPPSSTDPNFSDQSESSSKRYNRNKHKTHMEKKAKRSQSVLVDRMGYPQGHFYPFSPYPPGYPTNPWMAGHPADTPPSPSVSLRSLSRLSHSHRRRKTTDEDDFSSSPLSHPKSSSSELSKNCSNTRDKSFPSSSSSEEDEGVRKTHSKAKATPPAERKYLKQQKFRRKSGSPAPSHPNKVDIKQEENAKIPKRVESPQRNGTDPAEAAEQMKKMSLKDAEATSSSVKKKAKDTKDQESAPSSWQCKHCTFINLSSEHICQVCCKTASKSESPVNREEDTPPSHGDANKSIVPPSNTETQQTDDHDDDDEDSKEKRDIAVLNSALDEAEKQINESLVQLMKVKQESSQGKEDKLKSRYSSKQSALFNDTIKSGPVAVENRNHVLSAISTDAMTSTDQSNTSYQMQMLDQGTGISTTKPVQTNPDPGSHKDSFCQTYQDIEQVRPQATMLPPANAIMNEMASNIRPEYMQPSVPVNAYQAMLQEQGFNNGYGGMQRAHSQASLFPGRLNNALSPPVGLDYGNMNIGFGQSPMARSLSRASLLGEADGWSSAFQPRPKPDFYLSMEELVERRRQDTMRAQGLELVRMIREAEQLGFTADDIQVALNSCGKQNPVNWLQDNWRNIIKTVVTLATNYGKDKQENDVGVVSDNEARESLRFHKGNIWAAVTECVEGRQRKFLELGARGNFTPKEIVDALTVSEGDVELAYAKLTSTNLKPFLMRIWGSGEGVPNLEGSTFPHTAGDQFSVDKLKQSSLRSTSEDGEVAWGEDFGDDIEWEEEDNEDSDEEDEEERDESVGLSSQEIASLKSDDLEKSEKYHTLTHDTIRSPESDKSDYCDAFGSGLGDRYLSSTSIDEIYLIDGDIGDAEIEFESESLVSHEDSKKKNTGFLSKLAGFRKDKKLNKANQPEVIDRIEGSSNNPILDTALSGDKEAISVSDQECKEYVNNDESSKTFHPLNILKNTFSALKDTVVGSSTKPDKKCSPSMFDRRTIVVHDAVIPNPSKHELTSEYLPMSVEDQIKDDLNVQTCMEDKLSLKGEVIKSLNFSDKCDDLENGLSMTPKNTISNSTSNKNINGNSFKKTAEHLLDSKNLIINENEACDKTINNTNIQISESQVETFPEISPSSSDNKSTDSVENILDITNHEDIVKDGVSTSQCDIPDAEKPLNSGMPCQIIQATDYAEAPADGNEIELPFIDDKLDAVVDITIPLSNVADEISNSFVAQEDSEKVLPSNLVNQGDTNIPPTSNTDNFISKNGILADDSTMSASFHLHNASIDGVDNNFRKGEAVAELQSEERANFLDEMTTDKASHSTMDEVDECDAKLQNGSTNDESVRESKNLNETEVNDISSNIAVVVNCDENKGTKAKVKKRGISKIKSSKFDQINAAKEMSYNTEILQQSKKHIDMQDEKGAYQSGMEEKPFPETEAESSKANGENSDTVKDIDYTQLLNTENSVELEDKNDNIKFDISAGEESQVESIQPNRNEDIYSSQLKEEKEVENSTNTSNVSEVDIMNDTSENTNIVEGISVKLPRQDINLVEVINNVRTIDTSSTAFEEKEETEYQVESNSVVNEEMAEKALKASSTSQHITTLESVSVQPESGTDAKLNLVDVKNSKPSVDSILEKSAISVSSNNNAAVENNSSVTTSDSKSEKHQIVIEETSSGSKQLSTSEVHLSDDNKVTSQDVSAVTKSDMIVSASSSVVTVDTILPSTSKSMASFKKDDTVNVSGTATIDEDSSSLKTTGLNVKKEEKTVTNDEVIDLKKVEHSALISSNTQLEVEGELSTTTKNLASDVTSAAEVSAEPVSLTTSSRDSETSSDIDPEEVGEGQQDVEASSPVRPVGHLRRMSFNTRREAIFRERNRDSLEIEQKPWFLEKKVESYKPTLPKRSIKQQLEFERKVRKLVSDRKCRTYRKAEIVAQLMELKFEETESIYAANECSNLELAISFLQQECQLCTGKYSVSEIVSMVHCPHKACKECIRAYFTIQIRDRTIMELQCPFCNEPDITDEDIAQDYFNHLDMMLKKLVDTEIHELFQRKLRDRVLMKDPNFRWCSKCSSGFIADPYLKRLICPDCNAITCASCRRLWEREHEGVSCEVFAEWKDANEPEAQTAGLAKLLTEDGIDCPSCHFRYALAKGGCMHFKCIQCQHDFCSGCSQPFKMGKKCGVSDFCVKLGLHAHHPRNCLFYLRDKEPEDLQRLLDMNNIEYNKDLPHSSECKTQCDVMEQKETSQGMVDDICGKEVQEGYAGLCRVHFVEYLGQLVNKHKIDPIQIFENDDLELVLKRASIRLPPKKYRESNEEYRDKLVQLIEEKLPLGQFEGS